ncbi:MAG: hypothetical protein KBA81_05600 [Rhabdochlamydiaceae bacterium]|nr:hypothetical protein [Rhabdochlamydiaceae bacterium]
MQGNGTSARLHSEGPAAAVFVVTTHFNQRSNRAGRVECILSATAFKINMIIEERTEALDLKWGDSFELNPSIYRDWKIIFEAFNKTKTEYRENADDTFISIQSPQGTPS